MQGRTIGMRWWLAGAFVLIAVITAVLIASVSSRQVDQSVRSNSEDVAVGKTVSAAFAVERSVSRGTLADAVPLIAERRDLALFVFADDGRLISSQTSRGITWSSVPQVRHALATALSGHRFVLTTKQSATVTALPLRQTKGAGALVSFAARPPAYGRSLAIFRREVIRAALWAVLAAAGVGLVAAGLIARRLRRIDAAAAAIERGSFDARLRPGFRDEVGSLALSIDRMRRRLRSSFQQLEAERDRLGRLLEQLHQGVVAVGSDLTVQFANRAARETVGRDQLIPGTLLPASWEEVPLAELARGLFREDAQIAQARAETAGGRMISIAGVPAGGSELAVIVLTDVTEQQRRERAEREFVANASHELRTPVSAIVGAVDALQSGAKDVPADRERFIALIERQAGRLSRLIHSLLLLARAQTQQGELQLEPVQVRPLLEAIAAAEEADGPEFSVECPPELAALAQPDLVEQVLSNLVGNALKHAPRGEVRLIGRRAGANVVLEVSDNGTGMSAETQQRVFDRFFSGTGGRRDGFGLGLAIVQDAVRALGGSVELESRPGGGTTARVVLAAAASAEAELRPAAGGGGARLRRAGAAAGEERT